VARLLGFRRGFRLRVYRAARQMFAGAVVSGPSQPAWDLTTVVLEACTRGGGPLWSFRKTRDCDHVPPDRRFEQVIGNSPALEAVLEQVERVSPTDSTVLIQGETGTARS